MSLITCKDLTLGYDGRAVAEHISFTVNQGDYLCVIGENGSGKSTLMKTLLHLNQPLGGVMETGDGLKPGQIGYLPQQTAVQRDFPASVREVVLSGCQGRCGLRPFYEADGDFGPEGPVLPGSFRRAAAAGAAGKSPVRGGKASSAGRACVRTGSPGDPGDVSAD